MPISNGVPFIYFWSFKFRDMGPWIMAPLVILTITIRHSVFMFLLRFDPLGIVVGAGDGQSLALTSHRDQMNAICFTSDSLKVLRQVPQSNVSFIFFLLICVSHFFALLLQLTYFGFELLLLGRF